VGAEGRDFDDLAVLEVDVCETKAPSDDSAIAKEALDLSGRGRRSQVEIFGATVEQQIAHAPANQIRAVIEARQPLNDLDRIGVEVPAGDRPMHHGGPAVDRRGISLCRSGLARISVGDGWGARLFAPSTEELPDSL
jgi:hypothetical protein